MTKTVGSDVYQGQVATFVTINGEDALLGDLVPESNDATVLKETNFSIQFVGADGNQMKVADMVNIQEMENGDAIIAKYGTKTALFRYVPGTPSGKWYLEADKSSRDRKYPMNAMKIKNGQGYTVYAGNVLAAGAKLTYSGQVLDADLPFQVGSDTYIGTGNIAPADMLLGDFLPASNDATVLKETNFSIQFVGADGNQMKVKDMANIQEMDNGEAIITKYGEKTALFRYVPGTTPHWYLEADKSSRDRKFPMESMKIKAGQAFTAYAGNVLASGATLTLPNAIK